jgi:hypothetical protein
MKFQFFGQLKTAFILLTKLEFYGVTGTTLERIKSYLEGRCQKVILDNNSPIPIQTGEK